MNNLLNFQAASFRNAVRRPAFGALVALGAVALTGCGGGGGTATASAAPAGRLQIGVEWPAAARTVSSDAQSLRATAFVNGQSVGSQLVARPAASATFDGLPAGEVTVQIQAFASADGTGAALSQGPLGATVAKNATTQVALAVGSAATRLEFAPGTLSLTTGAQQKAVAQGRDAMNKVVVLNADDLTFDSSTPAVATVDASGTVFARSAGTAQITVTDRASGLQATLPVTVGGTGSLSLSVN